LGITKIIFQSIGKSYLAIIGGGDALDADDGRKPDFITLSWPQSTIKPPFSNDSTPIPDVPPLPTILAKSKAFKSLLFIIEISLATARDNCVPEPKPECGG